MPVTAPPRPFGSDGFEAWEHKICHTFVPLRARSTEGAADFHGQVRSATFGSVVLAQVAASQAQVERTPRLIRADDPELFKFGLQRSGTSLVEQDNRQALLAPGDLVIYDTSRPYRISFSDDFEMTVAMFPRTLLRLPQRQMASLTAVRVAGSAGPGALIAHLLTGLSAPASEQRPIIATHLGDAVIDLVTAAYAQRMPGVLDNGSPSAHRALTERVRKFIDERLPEPELTSTTVANAHFVSVRYLQKAFESEGTSVSSLIRTRRLERCRRDLADPACQELSIAQIGGRWGFADAAHFSRLFRSTYGQSPREFRKQPG